VISRPGWDLAARAASQAVVGAPGGSLENSAGRFRRMAAPLDPATRDVGATSFAPAQCQGRGDRPVYGAMDRPLGFTGARARRWLCALGLLTLIAVLAAPAGAARLGGTPATARAASAETARSMTLGFRDNEVSQFTNPADTATGLARAQQAGARVWGLSIEWARVSPTRPPSLAAARDPAWTGYDWSSTDAVVREITAANMQVLAVISIAPAWAEGPNRPSTSVAPPGTWDPSATWLGAFATALARRYSGRFADPSVTGTNLPAIHDWEPWNEPNLAVFLTPQWQRVGSGYQAASPRLYRALLNAFYAGVKAAASGDIVAAGATAPFGDPPGGARIPPAMFWRDLLCVSAGARPASTHCRAHVHFDAISHHPYPIGPPTYHALNTDDVSVADLAKITRLIPVARRAGTVLPNGSKPLWITEIAWVSSPDPHGVSLTDQALYLEGAIDVLYHEGASMFIWFDLRDKPLDPPQYTNLQSGVYLRGSTLARDQAKPSLTAFEFPFTAYRDAGFARLWGMAPTAGPVAIQEQQGTAWVTVLTLAAASTRVFSGSLLVGARTNLRAVSGSNVSLTWTTS
jgi:hypothetical protein